MLFFTFSPLWSLLFFRQDEDFAFAFAFARSIGGLSHVACPAVSDRSNEKEDLLNEPLLKKLKTIWKLYPKVCCF